MKKKNILVIAGIIILTAMLIFQTILIIGLLGRKSKITKQQPKTDIEDLIGTKVIEEKTKNKYEDEIADTGDVLIEDTENIEIEIVGDVCGSAASYYIDHIKSQDNYSLECNIIDKNTKEKYLTLRDCSSDDKIDNCFHSQYIITGKKSNTGRYIIFGYPGDDIDLPLDVYNFNFQTKKLEEITVNKYTYNHFFFPLNQMNKYGSFKNTGKCKDLTKEYAYTPECFWDGHDWTEEQIAEAKETAKIMIEYINAELKYVSDDSPAIANLTDYTPINNKPYVNGRPQDEYTDIDLSTAKISDLDGYVLASNFSGSIIYYLQPNQSVLYNIDANNRSNVATGQFDIEITVLKYINDNPTEASDYQEIEKINSTHKVIAPDDTNSISSASYEIKLPSKPGNYEIRIVADPENKIQELREDNNSLVTKINIDYSNNPKRVIDL